MEYLEVLENGNPDEDSYCLREPYPKMDAFIQPRNGDRKDC